MTTSSQFDYVSAESSRPAPLPSLLHYEEGPVFAEPWQAQAFALAVNLSEKGHFTWNEWAAALAHEFQSAASRGEPDDGTRYYDHCLTALERLVTTKGLTDATALISRKESWTHAYRTTPHGRPIELPRAPARPDGRWLLVGLACTVATYVLMRATGGPFGDPLVRVLASTGLGTLLGMRHALEPDHIAALSVLLTGERSVRKAAWLGVYWGIGHTLTLLAAGTLLVALRAEMPAIATNVLTGAVVLMLIGFGVRAIYLSGNSVPAAPTHSHVHAVRAGAVSRVPWTLARRPLLVGAVHGLAGSGALTALVMATIPSMGARLAYLATFGVGSTLGMAALSGLLGWPIARVGTHSLVARSISLTVGAISIMLGLYWGYPLFTGAR
jgi:nitrile hydratase accessory protein